MTQTRRKSTHYVSNKEFFRLICEYQERKRENPDERVPDNIARIFMMMADRIGRKGNFAGYHMLEDMKSHAVMLCVRYICSFDPAKSENPFAYFSQIIHNAFISEIASEKKQKQIRDKVFDKALCEGLAKDNFSVLNDIRRENSSEPTGPVEPDDDREAA